MANKKQIEDLVAMLDNFAESGGGHMNIQVENPDELEKISVETFKSSDCGTGDTACKIPNLKVDADEEQ